MTETTNNLQQSLPPPAPYGVSAEPSDAERPEPELSRSERRAERTRLRAVRQKRRRQMAASSKAGKNRGKERKKGKKGK